MSWDGFQREALAELGYRLYRPSDAGPPTAVEDAMAAAPAVAVGEVVAAAPSVPPTGGRPPTLHPLHLALLRAAGRTADDRDTARLCSEWPAPEALRTPAAKRALWPRLRALRARRR